MIQDLSVMSLVQLCSNVDMPYSVEGHMILHDLLQTKKFHFM